MEKITNDNFALTESGAFEYGAQNERKSSTSVKSIIVQQATHDLQGEFLGVDGVLMSVKDAIENLFLKEAIENQGHVILLLDYLIDASKTYKHKLINFLEYTRFDAGILNARPEAINLRDLMSRVVLELEQAAIEKNVTIDLSIANEIPIQIISDEFRISQIATNLLLNAIQFSYPDHQISVQIIKGDGNTWTMAVIDNGEGMTVDQLKCVLKLSPFERTTLRNPRGLGLLVTRYLVEDVLGGKITLFSKIGGGTQCQVVLPLG